MNVFEFNDEKSISNKQKHGINFVEAQELWNDLDGIEIKISYPIEERFLCIAIFNNKTWTAVFTKRGTKIRLISVRRSRDNERELYESKKEKNNDWGVRQNIW